MPKNNILMGRLGSHFNDSQAKSITFCVTEECNLRCKYCYMTDKNNFHRMSLGVAKQAVDFFLSQKVETDAVIWDFIGGEPLLEIDLIDQLSDYIKQQMYLRNHPWFFKYSFNLGTNGILYNDPRVQAYLRKNATHVSISMTIDGTREKHDLNRIFPNGAGSYDAIIENVKLWKSQFPYAQTKVTFASDDLRMLKDSIIHLWNLGLNMIPANIVFEDVWKDGDDEIYRQQLMELADYVLEHELWNDYSVRFFDPYVGHPMGDNAKKQRFCGTGRMVAVDCEGKLYPCIRFLDFCLSGKPALCIGNIYDGIDATKLKQFQVLDIGILNDNECSDCQVASGCFSCSGCNYENSPTNSIFSRTRYHCKLQKVQAECNEYFWTELAKRIHAVTPFEQRRMQAYQAENWQIAGARYLYFLISDESPVYCMYSPSRSTATMSRQTLMDGVKFAHANYMIPVFLGNPYDSLDEIERYRTHIIIDYASALETAVSEVVMQIPIISSEEDIVTLRAGAYQSTIMMVSPSNISGLSTRLAHLAGKTRRINIIKQALTSWAAEDIDSYLSELKLFCSYKKQKNLHTSINIFDHKENVSQCQCQAGRADFTLAPNGLLYACPAFYYQGEPSIGNLVDGLVISDESLYGIQKAVPCKSCEKTNCLRCIYVNKMETTTLNLAAEIQCAIAEQEEKLFNDVVCIEEA